jgi:transcriptional regulator of arginine metabolism
MHAMNSDEADSNDVGADGVHHDGVNRDDANHDDDANRAASNHGDVGGADSDGADSNGADVAGFIDSPRPALHRPATRAARLSAIEQALLTHIITSQSQLSSVLADEGIEVTQATLSRDLDEMNATKARLRDGTVAYTLGDEPADDVSGSGSERIEQQISRVLSGLVVSVADAGRLVVIHTPSGAAQYVASVIDRQPLDGVLGTIAGDDTVLMICAKESMAHERAAWLLSVASRTA